MEEIINQVLTSIKLRPGVSNNSDELLKDLITDTIQDIKDYINYSDDEELPVKLTSTVKEIVVSKCNVLGVEGISMQSSNGINEHYTSDFPNPIKRKLNRFRKIRW